MTKLMDLIERYRTSGGRVEHHANKAAVVAEVERMEAENAKLREALDAVCIQCDWYGDDGRDAMANARALLGKTK